MAEAGDAPHAAAAVQARDAHEAGIAAEAGEFITSYFITELSTITIPIVILCPIVGEKMTD